MKKFVSILLSVTMLISTTAFSVTTFADETDTSFVSDTVISTNNDVTISVDATYNSAAKTVTASYNLADNSVDKGFNNYTISLSYDKEVLSPASISNGTVSLTTTDALGGTATVAATGELNASTGKVVFVIPKECVDENNSLLEFTENGTLFTIVYNVIGTADSTTVGANVEVLNTVSSNSDIVSTLNTTVVPAVVSLNGSTGIKGDVNSDGIVSRVDLVRLCSYFAGSSVEINEYNADVTNDGAVTRNDLTKLCKYFAGAETLD